ncbi:MAG: hypothetical protein ACE5H3_11850 [Planctomycetota bacterium]
MDKKIRILVLIALGAGLTVVACPGGGSNGSSASKRIGVPFTFATSKVQHFSLRLRNQRAPVAFASVTLTAAQTDPDVPSADVFFRGATDASGNVAADVPIPTRFRQFDVVVQKRGLTGPFSREDIRVANGPFAPTARVTVSRKELSKVTIQVENS